MGTLHFLCVVRFRAAIGQRDFCEAGERSERSHQGARGWEEKECACALRAEVITVLICEEMHCAKRI